MSDNVKKLEGSKVQPNPQLDPAVRESFMVVCDLTLKSGGLQAKQHVDNLINGIGKYVNLNP